MFQALSPYLWCLILTLNLWAKVQNKMSRDVYNMKNNNEKETIIECVCRTYRIKTPGGLIAEVESTKPLSIQLTHELLEEDNEIDSFFDNHRIIGMRHMVASHETQETQVKERKIAEKIIYDQGSMTPRQRLNNLLKMKGEFTRKDYQNYMLDVNRVKIEKYMAYHDIRDAISAKRLVVAEGKSGRSQKYKVTDPIEIDEKLYKTIINEHKVHIGIVQ